MAIGCKQPAHSSTWNPSSALPSRFRNIQAVAIFALNFITVSFKNLLLFPWQRGNATQQSNRPNVFVASLLAWTAMQRALFGFGKGILENYNSRRSFISLARKRHLIFLKFQNTQEFTHTLGPNSLQALLVAAMRPAVLCLNALLILMRLVWRAHSSVCCLSNYSS